MRAEVFEYDNRFAAYGSDFHFFDYKAPLEVFTHTLPFQHLIQSVSRTHLLLK